MGDSGYRSMEKLHAHFHLVDPEWLRQHAREMQPLGNRAWNRIRELR